jgi:hypothetical protein
LGGFDTGLTDAGYSDLRVGDKGEQFWRKILVKTPAIFKPLTHAALSLIIA